MPYKVPLSKVRREAGWKVKIHDEEGPEEPHVTVYRKRRRWRVALRVNPGRFLDKGDKWSQLDKEVQTAIEKNWDDLRQAWDKRNPHNPVSSDGDE